MLTSSRLAVFVAAMTLTGAAFAQMAAASLDTSAPCEKPAYPRASLMNEETGTVTVALLIGPDGKAADSKVEKSSGFKNLDKAARAALAACKFKPAKEPTWQKVDYAWKLE